MREIEMRIKTYITIYIYIQYTYIQYEQKKLSYSEPFFSQT